MNEKPSTVYYDKKNVILLILLISVVYTIGAVFTYQQESNSIKSAKHNEIKAIAELKAEQIMQWRSERESEAEFFSTNAGFILNTQRLIDKSDLQRLNDYFKRTLIPIQRNHGYKNIYIISLQREILFSLDSLFTLVDSSIYPELDSLTVNKKIKFHDLHLINGGRPSIDLLAPIINSKNEVIAVLVFHMDPSLYLYKIIKSWPTPSKTSETFIFRKEKDSLLILNDLRSVDNIAVKLKISLKDKKYPSVQAANGREGIYEGVDYSNNKVLSHLSKLDNTPCIWLQK